jgi:hypothetical protein
MLDKSQHKEKGKKNTNDLIYNVTLGLHDFGFELKKLFKSLIFVMQRVPGCHKKFQLLDRE